MCVFHIPVVGCVFVLTEPVVLSHPYCGCVFFVGAFTAFPPEGGCVFLLIEGGLSHLRLNLLMLFVLWEDVSIVG